MRWALVAQKEVEDAIRARVLWVLIGLIAAMLSLAALFSYFIPILQSSAELALSGAAQFSSMLVPIMALVAAYLSIAGERESGSLKIHLGMAPSRADILVGKFVGRSVVVVVGVLAGFAVAGWVVFGVFGTLPVEIFVGVTGLTALLGVVFVAIAVGISASTATRSRAMTLAIAGYLLLVLLWDLIPQIAGAFLTSGAQPTLAQPPLVAFLGSVNPSGAYSTLVSILVSGQGPVVAGGGTPYYLSWWFLLSLLVLWALVPLAIGYYRFERADLS